MSNSDNGDISAVRPGDIRRGQAVDDLFPEAKRFLYGKAPAREVVCQIRFPQILRIASVIPADFQERIRHDFPIVSRGLEAQSAGLPQEVLQLLTIGQNSQPYIFASEDQHNKLTISVDSLAITTTNYTRWEHFDHLRKKAFEALMDIYRPTYLSRIGLRFINIIERDKLQLHNHSWGELINSSLLGEISEFSARSKIVEAGRLTRIEHDLGNVCLQHGFVVQNGKANPNSYILDADFYTDGKHPNESADNFIQRYHARARRVFSWSTTPKLREFLDPSPCDE